jgi:hypothetical protein
VRIPREQFQHFLNGSFSFLPHRPRPSRGRPRILLARVLPRVLPGLGAELRATHSVERCLRHLFLKGTLERLNENERTILTIISLKIDEPQFLVIEKLLQLQDYKEQQVLRSFGETILGEFPELFPVRPDNLKAFVPEASVYRIWIDTVQVRIPQRKRGHTDQGTLASTPSWKEQMLTQEEEKIVSWKKLRLLLRRFPSRSSLRLRVNSPTWK